MKGNITAETVVVDGEVSGEIIADKVEIGNTGKVYATITSAVFVIQEGGLFEGRKKIKIALIKEEENKGKKEDKKIEENKEKVAPVKKSTPKKVGEQNVIKANKTDTVDTTVKRVKQERQE